MSARSAVWMGMALLCVAAAAFADDYTLVGWNTLGLHCSDADYAVFALSLLFNTLEAQLVDADGRLVRQPAGVTVTYEAVADPDGSRNSTSIGKTNFWQFVEALFGVALPPDMGLAGSAMPGAANQPQPMAFAAAAASFRATGIPITPYDDAGARNVYPLMRLVARDAGRRVLASSDVVLPVSDQLTCRTCHASNGSAAAQPFEGWVYDPDPERDMRLNILRLHDDLEGGGEAFDDALAAAGYDAAGLYVTATAGHPILCARCHHSEAIAGSGLPGISPLSSAIHQRMARVLDPLTGMALSDGANRSACYRCHPGSVTRSVRGAMGAVVAADGSRAIQCQSCHGSMLAVAAPQRVGWLDEPTCQNCHTGTAVHNNGAIRYASVFEPDGQVRQAVDATFATNSDVPAPGLSLFRSSSGHGDLRCAACHGPAHAEYASAERNDNLQSERVQGHAGVLSECTACHTAPLRTQDGGPHGLHPIGAAWIAEHPQAAEETAEPCRACHGADYRGTVLSRALGERTFDTDFGSKHFWRGFQIGCFTCHRGPAGGDANPNRAPIAEDGSAVAHGQAPLRIALVAHDPDGDALTLRVVEQAQHGTVGLQGAQATYRADPQFRGTDRFTFTASDGSTDGTLATVVVSVSAAACPGDCDGSGRVDIDELVRGVDIALGRDALDGCDAFDRNGDGVVMIDELVEGIGAALAQCPA